MNCDPLHINQWGVINGLVKCDMEETWCPGADSNHRHEDFQSSALPTELPGLLISYL